MSLDENIEFLKEQRKTYDAVLTNARKVAESRALQICALRDELSSLRDKLRALRKTLTSDDRLPSYSAIHDRIVLENSINRDIETSERFERLLTDFEQLSDRWKVLQIAAQRLPKEDLSASDQNKLYAWADTLRSQLERYGFGSLPINQVVISSDTYRPEHEGFDLQSSFSLQNSISASDLIRTIWSYLCGLLELSRTEDTHHPGCIIFDEPRQQSTRDLSFSELLKRASSAEEYNQQVIFFTSENKDRLTNHLSHIPHTLKSIDGRVLTKLVD